MGHQTAQSVLGSLPRPREWYLPIKILVTLMVIMISLGMLSALGQIVVHDIIPTLGKGMMGHIESRSGGNDRHHENRGDLFASAEPALEKKPFYKTDEFIFALKFTHIHTFSMSAIFILMGAVTVFLDLGIKTKAWLITLPFVGVGSDLASVWLKLFVHPVVFCLHIPGGVLFGTIFGMGACLSLWQMWGRRY